MRILFSLTGIDVNSINARACTVYRVLHRVYPPHLQLEATVAMHTVAASVRRLAR